MMMETLQKIRQSPVIAILRGVNTTALEPVLEALCHGGIRNVEITMNTPGSLAMMERARELYGDRMCLGAGTVLDAVSARNAILAGADFLLAPSLSAGMIEMCHLYGRLAVPGVFTATEVVQAQQAGAGLIKVFPVGSVGPAYIKDLRGPLDHVNLLPVGGVDLSNIRAFMKAGAFAVGVGSCLVSIGDILEGNYDTIRERAEQFIREAIL